MFRAPSSHPSSTDDVIFISSSFFFYSFYFGPRIIVYRELFSTRRLFSRRGARHVLRSLYFSFFFARAKSQNRVLPSSVTAIPVEEVEDISCPEICPFLSPFRAFFSSSSFVPFRIFFTVSLYLSFFLIRTSPSAIICPLSLNSFYPLYQQNANTR